MKPRVEQLVVWIRRRTAPQLAVAAVTVVALVAVAVVVIDNRSDNQVVRADEAGDADGAASTTIAQRHGTSMTSTTSVTEPPTTATVLAATTSTSTTPTTSAPSTTQPTAPPPNATTPLDVQVTTDRTAYEPGQPVVITVTSCNRRPIVYRENHPLPHYRTRILNDRDETVADDGGETFPDAMGRTEWQPGECKVQRREWAQNSGPLSPAVDSRPAGERVPPGTYLVEITWNGYEERPPAQKPVYNSEPFRIV